MSTMNQYRDLNEFLAKHSVKGSDKSESKGKCTHARIGSPALSIYGGSYIIPTEDIPQYMKLYYEAVFINKRMEYLTEIQLNKDGCILIDIDLKYAHTVTSRQHNKDSILDLLREIYVEELRDFFIFELDKPFPIYIFEKPDVNRLADGSLTKDGIHIIIGIQMDHILQSMLRERVVSKIGEYWDLPLINEWEQVFDDTITKGTTGWQMYGSRKPGHDAYELTGIYSVSKDHEGIIFDEQPVSDFDLERNLIKLSARYDQHVSFELNPSIMPEYEVRRTIKKVKKAPSKTRVNLLCDNVEDDNDINLNEIINEEQLRKAVNNMLTSLSPTEYHIKEAHEYTQILPEKYWAPGSHLLNRQVGFALKHTDDRLFLSWILLRSKADDFDYGDISEQYTHWNKHFKHKTNGVTIRSIMYWARQDAFDEYEKIKKTTLNHYIEDTINSATEFDFALVLKHMFKDIYLCNSLVNRSWYVFKDHRWVLDRGQTLRMAISVQMYNVYIEKSEETSQQMHTYDASDERYISLGKRVKTIREVASKLKRTNDKNNIMREACELFFDSDFDKNMDSNKWLMCFKNGVVDIKNKEFRDGYPQDYITKSTKIPYVQFDEEIHGEISKEILTFMDQLFPEKLLNSYMWEHLSSVLIGENINQTFNIYRGSGSNGKSILTDLMTQTLGEYTGMVPITLVTEKRVNIGGTSSEIMQLKGVRYAVMQEPSKDARINEGMMKQLTGDSTLSGRALYCEAETFPIQFHLVVCLNTLFEITSNDDGTWRRIRLCDFKSIFVDGNTTKESLENIPYQFPKDKNLKDKLPSWAIVFASMLVKLAFENQGIVTDCDIVKASSEHYRQGQDHISAFVNDQVIIKEGKFVKQTELIEEFKIWYQAQQGSKKMPKGVELYEYMDKKFGKATKGGGWKNVSMASYYTEEIQNEEDY